MFFNFYSSSCAARTLLRIYIASSQDITSQWCCPDRINWIYFSTSGPAIVMVTVHQYPQYRSLNEDSTWQSTSNTNNLNIKEIVRPMWWRYSSYNTCCIPTLYSYTQTLHKKLERPRYDEIPQRTTTDHNGQKSHHPGYGSIFRRFSIQKVRP